MSATLYIKAAKRMSALWLPMGKQSAIWKLRKPISAVIAGKKFTQRRCTRFQCVAVVDVPEKRIRRAAVWETIQRLLLCVKNAHFFLKLSESNWMYLHDAHVTLSMRKLYFYKIQRRRKTIQKLVSVFGRMLDKGEKWAFLKDKFPKNPFQRRGTAV